MEANKLATPVPENQEQYKPGVGSSYRNAWQQMWKYFGALLPIFIIYLLISFGISYGFEIGAETTGESKAAIWEVLTWAAAILVVWPLSFGFAFSFLKAVRDNAPGLNDLFAFTENYWNAILANILMATIVFAGFILLIVPGVILACRLAFVPYLVVENKMGAYDAIGESWRLTSGHTQKVLLVNLMAIPVCLAGVLCLVVGIFPAMMWVTMSQASLYLAITAQHKPVSKPESTAL